MELIKRDHCVFSGRRDLEHLHTFKDFPVFVGCVSHGPEKDIKTDMSWWISRSTGSIQLDPLIPLDILYGSGHGSGSVGGLWQRHHQEFARFVHERGPQNVLEIGGGHGILAANYLRLSPKARWTIVEPNPAPQADPRVKVVRQLFNDRFTPEEEPDAVVHSHVLEHIYAPAEFIAAVSRLLKTGGRHFFSVPNMRVMLERKYNNCINFEHTVFLTEVFIGHVLRRNNFRVEEKRYFLEDHSIFYSAVREDGVPGGGWPDEYAENRRVFAEYVRYNSEMVRVLNERMKGHDGEIYLFGAHIFAQYLLGFGLDEARIRCLLDNDPRKQDLRLYGTNLIARPPEILRKAKKPVVILRAGVYNGEIREDILGRINRDVEFWEE